MVYVGRYTSDNVLVFAGSHDISIGFFKDGLLNGLAFFVAVLNVRLERTEFWGARTAQRSAAAAASLCSACYISPPLLALRSGSRVPPHHCYTGLDDCSGSNMAVNLSKNRLALLTAYQDVISETSATNW